MLVKITEALCKIQDRRMNAHSCPTAEAIREAFTPLYPDDDVYVSISDVALCIVLTKKGTGDAWIEYSMSTPEIASHYIRQYDGGHEPGPCEFELDLDKAETYKRGDLP